MFLPWLGIQLNGLIGTPVFVIYILSEIHLFPEILYGVTIVILILTGKCDLNFFDRNLQNLRNKI